MLSRFIFKRVYKTDSWGRRKRTSVFWIKWDNLRTNIRFCHFCKTWQPLDNFKLNSRYYQYCYPCTLLKNEIKRERSRKLKDLANPFDKIDFIDKFDYLFKYFKYGIKIKQCKVCKRFYPVSNIYFLKQNGSEDGFFDTCKACVSSDENVKMQRFYFDCDEKEIRI